MKNMHIELVDSIQKIDACYDVFLELRPHLKDQISFTAQILLQQKEGYSAVALFKENEAIAAMGFRVLNTLAWGKVLYIDDLITKEKFRKIGCAETLIKYAVEKAKESHCDQVHLDSGYTRNHAHRFYLHHGFELTSHHFSLKLKNQLL